MGFPVLQICFEDRKHQPSWVSAFGNQGGGQLSLCPLHFFFLNFLLTLFPSPVEEQRKAPQWLFLPAQCPEQRVQAGGQGLLQPPAGNYGPATEGPVLWDQFVFSSQVAVNSRAGAVHPP